MRTSEPSDPELRSGVEGSELLVAGEDLVGRRRTQPRRLDVRGVQHANTLVDQLMRAPANTMTVDMIAPVRTATVTEAMA